ncbi:MAG: hypothetical protein DRI97_17185 [Bacteroidetes bacterium]|nr:MAG: hypothetical protein DRI97_17185 [Bacteroidota bacterium]
MGLPRFIKLQGNKQFSYSPIYWDPEKEARDERIRGIKQEMGVEVPSDPNRSTIKRGSFRTAGKKAKVKASRTSNIRLLVILAILLLLAYLIFYR